MSAKLDKSNVEALHFRSVKCSPLGAYAFDWENTHTTAPSAVSITQYQVDDAADRIVHPMLWGYDNKSAQIRMWRSDNNAWSANATTSFDVIAIWL